MDKKMMEYALKSTTMLSIADDLVEALKDFDKNPEFARQYDIVGDDLFSAYRGIYELISNATTDMNLTGLPHPEDV